MYKTENFILKCTICSMSSYRIEYIRFSTRRCMYNRRGSRNFSKGGWGGKFWKKNVCWYTYQRVFTSKLDKHATLSLILLFKKIVFYFLLCFITLFHFEIWKEGVQPSYPPPLLDLQMYNLFEGVNWIVMEKIIQIFLHIKWLGLCRYMGIHHYRNLLFYYSISNKRH